jgi:hypothetical protein
MDALIAAIFYVIIQQPGHPPVQLHEQMPLSECLAEARLFLMKPHALGDGAKVQAGCVITIAPSINH